MNERVELSVLGFSFNQDKTGAYGLVLAEKGGIRRLMIVIGTPEAQSIAFMLQKSKPPRPLTHDTFSQLLVSLDIRLKESFIYQYEQGVFFSQMRLQQGEKEILIDSRTSDAVAIALRTNSPIFTTEEIMRELSIVISSETKDEDKENTEINDFENFDFFPDYSLLSISELDKLLTDALKMEDYEMATLLRDELKKRG